MAAVAQAGRSAVQPESGFRGHPYQFGSCLGDSGLLHPERLAVQIRELFFEAKAAQIGKAYRPDSRLTRRRLGWPLHTCCSPCAAHRSILRFASARGGQREARFSGGGGTA